MPTLAASMIGMITAGSLVCFGQGVKEGSRPKILLGIFVISTSFVVGVQACKHNVYYILISLVSTILITALVLLLTIRWKKFLKVSNTFFVISFGVGVVFLCLNFVFKDTIHGNAFLLMAILVWFTMGLMIDI